MSSLRRFHGAWVENRPSRRVARRCRIGVERLEGRRVPAVLSVGPAETYTLPSQAAAAAHDGDVISIDAGTYRGDVAVWTANNLTIQGVGGRAVIDDTGADIPNRKAIWVISGDNTTVQNVELTGAHDPTGADANWAGIRQEGANLTLLGSYIHDNDEGLLTGANPASDITVKSTEFAFNGYGDGYSHNIYVGQVRSFTLEFSSSHDAAIGHLVKSRAETNRILYNRLTDGANGTSSYALDLPNGGASYVIGNVIEKGPKSDNSTSLSYAEEGASNAVQELYVVNNAFVNDLGGGTFVAVGGTPADVRLVNNIFAGGGTVLSGPGTLTTNLVSDDPVFVDRAGYDYHLVASSPAIDAGTNPGTVNGVALTPVYQYTGLSGVARPVKGALDIGAFEYSTNVLRSVAVTPANPSTLIGGHMPFTATATYSDGTSQDVTS